MDFSQIGASRLKLVFDLSQIGASRLLASRRRLGLGLSVSGLTLREVPILLRSRTGFLGICSLIDGPVCGLLSLLFTLECRRALRGDSEKHEAHRCQAYKRENSCRDRHTADPLCPPMRANVLVFQIILGHAVHRRGESRDGCAEPRMPKIQVLRVLGPAEIDPQRLAVRGFPECRRECGRRCSPFVRRVVPR